MENFLYNPDQKNKIQLKEEFVVRTEVLADIMGDLENSDMTKPEQHYLLVGQRGTGKTTMLLRLRYAIEDSEKLNNWLIPVGFNEEQYNVTELANLWISIAEFLEDNHGFKGLVDIMEDFYGSNDFEEKCYEALEEALKQHNKKIVLLIDNIGDLFKKFDDKEVRRLREILQTKNYVRLIAGSPFYLDTILDYQQPFFEFFKVKRLDGLNEEEARSLLRKLGDIYGERGKIDRIIAETPQRIETLRILTSGVPRTITLLFQIFIDHEHESSMKDLMRVLDAVTPLYKHRMDDLPTQQQKIVDAVARNGDAISVKELKEKVKLESKVISAQLRQLEKNQVIEKRETGTKNHIYLLQDRFWNIWYLMRNGRRKETERVVWLVRFLESWCTTEDFEKRISTYVNQIKEGKLDENAKQLYGEVYASLKNLTGSQKFLLKNNIDKEIGKRIYIDEKEAVQEAERLFKKENFLDGIKALMECHKLSHTSKELIANGISELDNIEFSEFGQYITSEENKNLHDNAGYLTALLETLILLIIYYFDKNEDEDANSAVDLMIEMIRNVRTNYVEQYESEIIAEIIAICLCYKKFKLASKIFHELNQLQLSEKFKATYIATQYFLNKENHSILTSYGKEFIIPTLNILKFIKNYWSKNRP